MTKCNGILVAALVAALGLSHAQAVPDNHVQLRRIIYQTDINEVIDKNLLAIQNIVLDLDPTDLDDVKFPVVPSIFMNLESGTLQNLSWLKRAGKCTMTYSKKVMIFDLILGWDDLVFDYRYLLRVILSSRRGDFHGELHKCKIHIVFEVNFGSYQITLKKMDFADTGSVELLLEGHIFDFLYNKIISLGTILAKDLVLKTIEEKGKLMVMRRIDDLNVNLGQIVIGNNHSRSVKRLFTFVDETKPRVYTHLNKL